MQPISTNPFALQCGIAVCVCLQAGVLAYLRSARQTLSNMDSHLPTRRVSMQCLDCGFVCQGEINVCIKEGKEHQRETGHTVVFGEDIGI